jgi:hypothetical protein
MAMKADDITLTTKTTTVYVIEYQNLSTLKEGIKPASVVGVLWTLSYNRK